MVGACIYCNEMVIIPGDFMIIFRAYDKDIAVISLFHMYRLCCCVYTVLKFIFLLLLIKIAITNIAHEIL